MTNVQPTNPPYFANLADGQKKMAPIEAGKVCHVSNGPRRVSPSGKAATYQASRETGPYGSLSNGGDIGWIGFTRLVRPSSEDSPCSHISPSFTGNRENELRSRNKNKVTHEYTGDGGIDEVCTLVDIPVRRESEEYVGDAQSRPIGGGCFVSCQFQTLFGSARLGRRATERTA